MSESAEILESEVMGLPAPERARLVERLIASLDADPEVERAWDVEAQRRNAELESGAAVALPGPETLAKIKTKFR